MDGPRSSIDLNEEDRILRGTRVPYGSLRVPPVNLNTLKSYLLYVQFGTLTQIHLFSYPCPTPLVRNVVEHFCRILKIACHTPLPQDTDG